MANWPPKSGQANSAVKGTATRRWIGQPGSKATGNSGLANRQLVNCDQAVWRLMTRSCWQPQRQETRDRSLIRLAGLIGHSKMMGEQDLMISAWVGGG
jgi:hypothetical protein